MEVYNRHPDHEGLQAKVEYTGLHPVPTYGHQQYFSQEGQPEPQRQVYGSPEPRNKIFGLRRTTFWLALILVLVIVAAIVAGTVGGVLGSQKANSTSVTTTAITVSTPAPTTSPPTSISGLQAATNTNSYTALTVAASHVGTASQPSPSSSALRGGCPSTNGQQWVSASGYNNFQIYCGTDFPVNDMINGEYVPISNFDACLEFCASLNDKRNFTLCYGVSYGFENTPEGGCYLKNPAIDVANDQMTNKLVDSAILTS